MTSGVALQLFPAPPSSSTAAGGATAKPKRKPSRRKAATPTPTATPTPPSSSPQAVERTKSPTALEEIVIQVSEPSKAVSRSTTPVRAATPSTERVRAASPALTTREDVRPGRRSPAPSAKEDVRPTGNTTSKECPRAVSPAVTEKQDRQHLKETATTERARAASPATTVKSDVRPSKTATSRPAVPASRATSPALTKDTISRPGPPLSRATSPALTKGVIMSEKEKLMRSNSDTTVAAPIRSIFPQYNPSVPLAHQNYRPTQASPKHIPREYISKEPYSPSLYSTGSPGQPTTSPGRGCLSASSTVSSFPAGVLASHPARYSTLDELVDLWEAANGQGTPETGKTFALKVTRDGSVNPHSRSFIPSPTEAFTIGPSHEQPFYDFQTLRGNEHDSSARECHIRRRHPRTGTVIPVMNLDIELASRQQPKEDGFVTSIYPKLAAMMAMDRTRARIKPGSSTAVVAGISSSDAGDGTSTLNEEGDVSLSAEELEKVTQDAVRRAARYERCQLYWDHDSSRYYLLHPGLNRPHGQRFVIDAEGGCGFDVPGARGSIRISTSTSSIATTTTGSGGVVSSSSVSSAAGAGAGAASTPGSSVTITNGETKLETLGAIEFSPTTGNNASTASLLIDTAATARIPCLYMVDIVVSALVAVGIVEGRKIGGGKYIPTGMSSPGSFVLGGVGPGAGAGVITPPPPVAMMATTRTMTSPSSPPPPPAPQSTIAASASASAIAAAAAARSVDPTTSVSGTGIGTPGRIITEPTPATTRDRIEDLERQSPPPAATTTSFAPKGKEINDKKKEQGAITNLLKSIFWLISLLFDALTKACRGGGGGNGGVKAEKDSSSPSLTSSTSIPGPGASSPPPLANQV